jgi:FHS family L-fucose permease-like MFS transporter
MNKEKSSNALPIAMMFALFFMIAFVTGLPSPMGVIVAKQFGATNFESQLGFFANFIAYAFMGIPAGLMLKKIGYKKTALAAIAVGFTGVGVQFLSGQLGTFSVYLMGAFISGFSMCMLNAVVNPMLNTLGGGKNKGNQLIQFGGSINSIAATMTPMLVGYLMGAEAGRTIEKANPALFLAMGIFALAFVVLAVVRIPEPHKERVVKATENGKDLHSPFAFRHFLLGTLAIFVYVGVEIGIPSTANLYLTAFTEEVAFEKIAEFEKQQADAEYLQTLVLEDEQNKLNDNYIQQVIGEDSFQKAQDIVTGRTVPGLNIDAGIAGVIVGIYWLLMLIGRLVGASVGAKVSSRSMMTFVTSLGLIFMALAILLPTTLTIPMPISLSFDTIQIPVSILFIVLGGLSTSIMWGSIFNLAVEGLGKYTEAASGFFMVMVSGGGIIPLIQGYAADNFGYLNSYWVMFACIAYMLWYAVVGSKNVNTDIPVD